MTYTVPASAPVADHDYVSPNYSLPEFESHFPYRELGHKHQHPWTDLRSWVPHHWWVDRRNPLMGFLSADETSVLYTLAGLIPDAHALEIGSHRGWSTAHIAASVQSLAVIDPAFSERARMEDVSYVLKKCGVMEKCSLYEGFSPSKVTELGRFFGDRRWDFAFIDGDHEGDASRADAEALLPFMANTAVVVFHDLASPDVANGLAYMRSLGWNTMVFQTMQIMGVAWRGNVTIPVHTPDPEVQWSLPNHLRSFAVSGETPEERNLRLDRFFADMTSYDPRARAKALLLPGAAGPIGQVKVELVSRNAATN